MADTVRTIADLLTIFADGQPNGSITPQDVRDLIVTVEDFDNAKADAADVTAEASTRAAADTALDTRVDALEAAPPAHTHAQSDVTGLVSDLAALDTRLDALETAPPPAPEGQDSYVISGGGVAYVSGYSYTVSAADYLIRGATYASPATPVTLGAADATWDRIDVIAVDDTGAVVVLAGTPAASPVKPAVDALAQLELTFVVVSAGTTAPPGVVTATVFAEGAGGEWTVTPNNATVATSTTSPLAGTTSLRFTAAGTGHGFVAAKPGGAGALDAYSTLALSLRVDAAWANKRSVTLAFRNASGARVGSLVTLANGAYGLATGTLATTQALALPLSAFALPTGTAVADLQVLVAGSTGTLSLTLDGLVLQGSTGTGGAPAAPTPKATASTSGTVRTDVTESDPLVYTKATADTLLAGKAAASHTHAQSDVTGLVSDLAAVDGRLDALEAGVAGGASQSAHAVLAGPTSGGAAAPTFRALVAGDIPTLAQSQVTSLVTDLAAKAPLVSPALTGTPTAPTASAGDNSTKLATTAYVDAAVAAAGAGGSGTYSFFDVLNLGTPGSLDDDFSAGSLNGKWSLVGQTPTVTMSAGAGVILQVPLAGSVDVFNGGAIEQTLPSGSFSLFTMQRHVGITTRNFSGLYVRNATTGVRYELGLFAQSTTASKNYYVCTYSNFTTRTSVRQNNSYGPGPVFLRLTSDGTTLTAYVSGDGVLWSQVDSMTLSALFSTSLPDRVGLINDRSGSTDGAAAYRIFKHSSSATATLGGLRTLLTA